MTLHTLLLAMAMVESGNDPNVAGDHGRAIGPLQIHSVVIQDVNRIYNHRWTHEGMRNHRNAFRVAELYLMHYVPKGSPPEHYARVWNGGPSGALKESTLPYWHKVKAQLESQ